MWIERVSGLRFKFDRNVFHITCSSLDAGKIARTHSNKEDPPERSAKYGDRIRAERKCIACYGAGAVHIHCIGNFHIPVHGNGNFKTLFARQIDENDDGTPVPSFLDRCDIRADRL